MSSSRGLLLATLVAFSVVQIVSRLFGFEWEAIWQVGFMSALSSWVWLALYEYPEKAKHTLRNELESYLASFFIAVMIALLTQAFDKIQTLHDFVEFLAFFCLGIFTRFLTRTVVLEEKIADTDVPRQIGAGIVIGSIIGLIIALGGAWDGWR